MAGGSKRARTLWIFCLVVAGMFLTGRSYVPESVRLGVLLPISGSWRSGRAITGAATLAVERINRDASLLMGKTVEYIWLDGGCNASQSLAALTKLLEDANISAIVGPGALSFGAACAGGQRGSMPTIISTLP